MNTFGTRTILRTFFLILTLGLQSWTTPVAYSAENSVISRVKDVGAKYKDSTEAGVMKDPRLISHEVKGNSHIFQLFDQRNGIKLTLIFIVNKELKDVRYRDRDQNGYDLMYYPNGQVSSWTEYERGKLTGELVKFHKNGQLQYSAKVVDGLPGKATFWDENGKKL